MILRPVVESHIDIALPERLQRLHPPRASVQREFPQHLAQYGWNLFNTGVEAALTSARASLLEAEKAMR